MQNCISPSSQELQHRSIVSISYGPGSEPADIASDERLMSAQVCRTYPPVCGFQTVYPLGLYKARKYSYQEQQLVRVVRGTLVYALAVYFPE